MNEEILALLQKTGGVSDSQFGVGDAMSLSQIQELSKALLAPESVDALYTDAGGVVTRQSLEGTLASLTLNTNDFTFWQDVNKTNARSTVHEFDQETGFGLSDGGFVDQIENPEFRDPDFDKQIVIMKYMSEGWTVGDVELQVDSIIERKAMNQRQAMKRLLRNLDMAMYRGNSAWVPKAIDGLEATIASQSSDQVRDLRGGNLDMAVFNTSAQLITEGNGQPDNSRVYMSPAAVTNLHNIIEQSAEGQLVRKNTTMGAAGQTIGGNIGSIMTSFGTMQPRIDKLLGLSYEARGVPVYYDKTTKSPKEGATSEKAPSVPTVTLANNATATGSQFAASTTRPSGVKYNYRVAAMNEYGRSIASVSVESSAAVAAGGAITLTITPNQLDSGSKLPTCFEIYSEKVSGSGDFKYLHTVPVSSSNPLTAVTYQDKNDYIPGTARMFIVDQTTSGESRCMAMSQLLPIHNTDLAKIGRFDQGLINLYIAPIYYKPNVLIEIRNIGIGQARQNIFNIV